MANIRQIQLFEDSQHRVIESGMWISLEQLASRVNVDAADLQGLLDRWKDEGRISSIEYLGESYYPAFGLDFQAGCRPVDSLKKVLDVLGERASGWHLAFWFCSENSYLDGRRPADLLDAELDQVLSAAKWEAQGVQHG